MNTKHLPDGVLVYDRFFGAKPSALLLALEKLLLCCAAAVFGMLFILTQYDLPVSLPLMAGVTAGVAAGFSLLFIFVKRRLAVPITLGIVGAVVWFNLESLWERFSYFVDAAMLLVEGRFLHPRSVLLHSEELLNDLNPLYLDGVTLGCALLCSLFAFIAAVCFAKRTRPLPLLITFCALCVPRLLSETLEFNLWLVPFAGCMAAAFAISVCYKGGLAVKGIPTDYRRAVVAEERSFRVNANRADYPKRVQMSVVHYSKYFSVGVYCALIFAAAVVCSASVFGKGSYLDYTKAYDFIMSIGDDAGITSSPFDEGPVSEYFTTPKKESRTDLNITSPGSGEQEIIRVNYGGTEPLYLRGDIGIDFTGTSWTSPVNEESPEWRDMGLAQYYRPCEGRVIHSLLKAMGYSDEDKVSVGTVTIDYLCETSVVFLPPYTAEYSYYANELFEVYGDFVVRVNEENGVVNTVQCTAVTPKYTDMDNSSGGADVLFDIETAFDASHVSVGSIYSTVVPEMESDSNVIEDYGDFVAKTYLGVPVNLSEPLDEFLISSGLLSETVGVLEPTEAQRRYAVAKVIADYLRENYDYTLNDVNDHENPIMSFLNDTKMGHCSLYASSMVLLLRQMGIPARYCTGFMVDPAKVSGVQTLRAKNLHAWCEVYLGELGWATFDPTSSSVYPSAPERPAQTTARSEVTTSAPPRTTAEHSSAVVTTAVTTEPVAESENGSMKVILLAAGILLALIAVVSLVGWALHRLRRRAEDRFRILREGDPSVCAEECYRLILAALEIYGAVPKQGELPSAFFKRADGLFGTTLCEDTELLEALAFGTPEVSDSDRSNLIHHLNRIYRGSKAKHSPVRRLKLLMALSGK